MVQGVFTRSPYAHAKIVSINIDEAKKMPGVIDIFIWRKVTRRRPYPICLLSIFYKIKMDHL